MREERDAGGGERRGGERRGGEGSERRSWEGRGGRVASNEKGGRDDSYHALLLSFPPPSRTYPASNRRQPLVELAPVETANKVAKQSTQKPHHTLR